VAKDPDKAVTLSTPYAVWESYSHDEIDPSGASIVGDYDDPRVNSHHDAQARRRSGATPDIFKDQNFTIGLVLAPLSGPWANNDASTSGRLTKLLSVRGTRPWWEELSVFQSKKPPLRAIVKIFGLTPDLPMPENWPPSERDEQIISLYPEYVAIDPDMPKLSEIRPGTIVRVQHNRAFTNNAGPLPVGTIVGVLGNRPADVRELRTSAKSGFSPKCASPLELAGSAGGNYTSHTIALIDSGRLVRKVKNKISLGVFGEGSAQTKAHFVASLDSAPSVHHSKTYPRKINGGAPNFKNAFIWVGHMKNNGYMDYVDRPPDLGRETIIYAPKYLDTGVPIELKYYFHDRAGFGMAWINGPGTQVAQSIVNASENETDFKEIIGPAIKSMMASGRNFILVIPEMMHSRGYGTKLQDDGRVSKLKTGKDVGMGSTKPHDGDIQRVMPEAEKNLVAVKAMKNLVDSHSRAATERVTGLNRWKERVYSTFDNSYTGGNFSSFHGEVGEVIGKYLGAVTRLQINYVSITAVGAGVSTLAAMSTYAGAANPFDIKIDRIDLVNSAADEAARQSPQLGNKFPAVVFYEKVVNAWAKEGKPLEFNYFTKYDSESAQNDGFFSGLGFDPGSFNKYYKPGKIGRTKSHFNPITAPSVTNKNFTSLYLSDKPELMAMTSINDFVADQVNRPPLMRSSLPRILNGEVPDHADIIASKPMNSKLLDLQARKQELESKMGYFDEFLVAFKNRGQDNICLVEEGLNPDWGFCVKVGGSNLRTLDISPGSALQSAYKLWYADLKELARTEVMLADRDWMMWVENLPKHLALEAITDSLTKEPGGVNVRLSQVKKDTKKNENIDKAHSAFYMPAWAEGDKQRQNIRAFLGSTTPGKDSRVMPMVEGYIEEYVQTQRKKHLEDSRKRILGSTDDQSSTATKADCPAPPRSLGIFGGSRKINGAYSAGVVQCGSLDIGAAPEDYVQLARHIPYYPKKSDVMAGNKDDKLKRTPGYQLAGIKHLTRRSGGNISYINSGDYGTKVWGCLAQKIQSSWETACVTSKYIPFRIFAGYRKEKTPNIDTGISLHDLGLAIDIDPSLNGNDIDWTRGVFTNAWMKRTVGDEDIDALGVYAEEAEDLMDNVYEDWWGMSGGTSETFWDRASTDRLRRSETYDGAYGAYEEDLGTYLTSAHKDNIICPINSNPLLWVLVFCETSGMRWGNGTFMRKRYRGGSDWLPAEKDKLDRIFGITNVVDRVRAISWKTEILNDHMHFQFWGGKSFITFEEIAEAARLNGVVYNL